MKKIHRGSSVSEPDQTGRDYVTENFRFGPKETEGVRAAQERADLLVTGTVNEETWAALRAQSCECEEG